MKDPTSQFCFGKYDIRELLVIVQKKFVDGFSISTVELLKKAQNDEESVMQLLGYKGNFMNQNNRTEERLPFKKGCILANCFGSIKTQIVDMSRMGLKVKTDSTLPFKFISAGEMAVFIPSISETSLAKLMWAKKDSINTTRLGLKFSTSIID